MEGLADDVEKRIEEHKEVYRKKKQEYGNTWSVSGELIDTMLDGREIEIESPEDVRDLAVFARILDKMSRIANLRFTGQQNSFESVEDSCQDAGIYLFMLAEFIAREEEKSPDGE